MEEDYNALLWDSMAFILNSIVVCVGGVTHIYSGIPGHAGTPGTKTRTPSVFLKREGGFIEMVRKSEREVVGRRSTLKFIISILNSKATAPDVFEV